MALLWNVFNRLRGDLPDGAQPVPIGARAVLKHLHVPQAATFVCPAPMGGEAQVSVEVFAVVAQRGRVFFEVRKENADNPTRFDAASIHTVLGPEGERMSPTVFMTHLGVCGIELACIHHAWAEVSEAERRALRNAS